MITHKKNFAENYYLYTSGKNFLGDSTHGSKKIVTFQQLKKNQLHLTINVPHIIYLTKFQNLKYHEIFDLIVHFQFFGLLPDDLMTWFLFFGNFKPWTFRIRVVKYLFFIFSKKSWRDSKTSIPLSRGTNHDHKTLLWSMIRS